MTFDQHANLAITTVATAPSPALSGVSLTVAAGTGSWFATPPFNVTVWPAGTVPTPANSEIVRVTGISTDTLTIVRATNTEPTVIGPIAITSGMQIGAANSAKSLLDVQSAIPTSLPPSGSAGGVLSGTYPNPGLASGVAIPGSPTTTTQAALDDSTKVATTAYADNAVAAETSRAEAAEALLAPKASPALTGSPTAPTQTTGDASTKVATDQFVATAVAVETTRAEAAEALLLPLAGGTMSGAIAMGSHKVTGLTNGSSAQDAAAFGQIPTALPPSGSAGGSLTGSYPNPTVATIPSAATGTTQAPLDNSTKVSTTAYTDSAVAVETTRAEAAEALSVLKANNGSDFADAGTTRLNLHVPDLTPAAVVVTTNVASLSGLNIYDGYQTVAGDLILLTAQTTASQNGLWTAASGSWTRPTEMATGASMKARTCAVINGTVGAGQIWMLKTNSSITVDTTAQTWVIQVTSASYSPSRLDYRVQGLGLKGQVWDLWAADVSGVIPGSQTLLLVACGFLAGDVITNLYAAISQAGSGTAPTGIYLGIYSSALSLLASTANLASSSAFTSLQFAQCALSSPYTITSSGMYYLGFLKNGAFGTTDMAILRNAGALVNPLNRIVSGTNYMAGQMTGQATLPSTVTFVASYNDNIWLGWS